MNHERAPAPPSPGQAPTVSDLLAQARRAGVDRLDAQLMLGRLLQQPRAWLIAHDDHIVGASQTQDFMAPLAEPARGVPLAYLLGEREFLALIHNHRRRRIRGR